MARSSDSPELPRVPDAWPVEPEGERPRRRRMGEMAAIVVVVHVLALVGLRVGVLAGVPPVPAAERHAWLGEFPAAWTLAWGAWILASFTFLGWFLYALWELGTQRIGRAAVWLAAVATVVGLAARVFLSGGLSLVATLEPVDGFTTVERVVWGVELVPTRLLQAAAVLVGTLALARRRVVDRRALVTAWLYLAAALAVACLELAGRHAVAVLAVGPETVLLSAWALVTARQARRAA